MAVDLTSEIAGLKIETVLMNASGPRDVTFEELAAIGGSRSSAIVVKSTTIEPRQGNPEPRYYADDFGSINSMGLPNLGYHEYEQMVPKLKRFGKPVIASIAGFSASEYVTMSKAMQSAGSDAIELNLSCPNVAGKPQAGYDFGYCEEILSAVRPEIRVPLGCKLPPYLEIAHQEEMARLLLRHKVEFITLINSVGNALFVDSEKETAVIKPKKGLGGLGGRYIKPVALGNIWSFYNILGGKIPIKGCGGVYTGIDAFEHLLCGASAVQVGTALYNEGPQVFGRIESELGDLLERKGYSAARDAIGKLKVIS